MVKRTIAFLGPEGTHSEQVALEYNHLLRRIPCRDFFDVMKMVQSGKADLGAVAVENMIHGMVRENLDYLYQMNLYVQAEALLPVHHALCALPGAGKPKVICGHPQALAQCRQYLREHYPAAELRPTPSTTYGMQEIAKKRLKDVYAIGSLFGVERHHLEVVDSNIEDVEGNLTRFWIVGRELDVLPKHDKFSISYYFEKDRAGCLYHSLGFFAEEGINLTCITSCPSLRQLGNYIFHLDLDGNLEEERVSRALNALRAEVDEMKIAGSYERGKIIGQIASK